MTIPLKFLAANEAYSAQFTKGDLLPAPRRRVAILTCMDARLDPARFLGLEEGDAHVIRNAGARATEDAIRSVVISQQLLGTREVVVIHHTGCGMLSFTNEQLRAKIQSELGVDAAAIDFLPFDNEEDALRWDVAAIRGSPLILPNTSVSGFMYDVKNGKLIKA